MAVADMLQLLKICCQLSGVEAMMLISVAADLRIGQACGNMPLTLRLEMPKITGLTALPR
jgi:acetamidase/formamidase